MLLRKIFLIEIVAKLNYCLWLQVVLQGDFIMRCCENPMPWSPSPEGSSHSTQLDMKFKLLLHFCKERERGASDGKLTILQIVSLTIK